MKAETLAKQWSRARRVDLIPVAARLLELFDAATFIAGIHDPMCLGIQEAEDGDSEQVDPERCDCGISRLDAALGKASEVLS